MNSGNSLQLDGDGKVGADLSAYPVIRLDQLSLLDKSTLARAKVDVSELLVSLRSDEPSSQMIFYLQKQLDAMSAEEVRREAAS